MGRTIIAAVIASACLVQTSALAQTGVGTGSGVSRGTRAAPRASSGGPQDPPPPAPPSQPQPATPGAPSQISPAPPPSALDSGDVFRASPRTYAPRFDRSSRRNRLYGYGTGFTYIQDPFGYISQPESSSPALDRYMRQGEPTGYLRLDVEPEHAEVYVDGLYAGTVADFRRGGRALDPGPHRIEMRAEGFDSQSVELRVRANDTLAYRGTLTRRNAQPEAKAAAGTPKTFYVIPRCYAGDTPPRPEQLPAGCRAESVRTIPPVLNDARSPR